MGWYQALLLGVLEGLTEFLPVSSTGHLLLLQKYFHLQGTGDKAFAIVIQAGALLAAVLYYHRTYWNMLLGLIRKDKAAWQLFLALVTASIPLLGVGYLFRKQLEIIAENATLIAMALLIGGIAMVLVEKFLPARKTPIPLQEFSSKRSWVVGLFQTLALWPGMSRSMTSILGGRVAGLDRVSAADFSFLLALPTLGVVTLYKSIQAKEQLAALGMLSLSLGLITSFVVGGLVITAFLRYLKRFSLAAFGYYRIILGIVVLVVTNGHEIIFWLIHAVDHAK